MPLSKFQVTLGTQRWLYVFLLFLNQPGQRGDGILKIFPGATLVSSLERGFRIYTRVKVGLIDCQVNLCKLVCQSLILLSSQKLLFEIIQNALTELVVSSVLS